MWHYPYFTKRIAESRVNIGRIVQSLLNRKAFARAEEVTPLGTDLNNFAAEFVTDDNRFTAQLLGRAYDPALYGGFVR